MRKRRDGFTLLELLVAISLVGLLMVLVLGGVRFGARAWQAGQTSSVRISEMETAQNFLRSWLDSALPFVFYDDLGEAQPALVGNKGQLRFLTAMPPHLGGGYYVLTVAIEDWEQAKALVVRRQPARLSPRESLPTIDDLPTVLVTDVAAVSFEYLTPDEEGRATWVDDWDGSLGLPSLIRIDLRFRGGDRRRWPPLIIAPKLNG